MPILDAAWHMVLQRRVSPSAKEKLAYEACLIDVVLAVRAA